MTLALASATAQPAPAFAATRADDFFGDAVQRERFVAAMAQAVTGVTVVTTADGASRAGATVSAMSSVSADPPLVLVCIHRNAPTCAAVRASGVFCVNVLDADQREIAAVFAGQQPAPGHDKFGCGDWGRLSTGAPVLDGAVVSFDCRIAEARDMGTHTVFIGLVVDAAARSGTPLLYSNRCYGRPMLAAHAA